MKCFEAYKILYGDQGRSTIMRRKSWADDWYIDFSAASLVTGNRLVMITRGDSQTDWHTASSGFFEDKLADDWEVEELVNK